MATVKEVKKQQEIDLAYAQREEVKRRQEEKMWSQHEKANKR